jgi:hypothetical protein
VIVEILDGLGKPVVLSASRVVIRTDQGTPITLAIEWQRGAQSHITAATAKDPDFNQVLENLGIDRVEVKTIVPRRVSEFDWSV